MLASSCDLVNKSWFPGPAPVFGAACVRTQVRMREHLRGAISNSELPSYVYTYPPRQAYRPLTELLGDADWTFDRLSDSAENFNLYLHFPFCRQICSYCNLFAVADARSTSLDTYIDAIAAELGYYRDLLCRVRLRTVFLGGGTPSLLTASQLERVFRLLDSHFPGFVSRCEEICIEAAPDTITKEKFQNFKDLGINRVNLGVQTFSDSELYGIGRRHSTAVCREAIDILKSISFDNLVLDLINGLLEQGRDAWLSSVYEVVKARPETICTYFLKVRPATGFFNKRSSLCNNVELYERFELARQIILAAGYEQETNIRYRIPGRGGYRQKVYHWSGATVLGIGAGARTYSPTLHFRNGYSARNRGAVLRRYYENLRRFGHSREDGFVFDHDEQIRRFFILNLHDASKEQFAAIHHVKFDDCFVNLIAALTDEGLLSDQGDRVKMTASGFKYRDLISWLFFSEEVAQREAAYVYD